MSRKHGSRRPIRIFSLEPWERAQIRDFALGSMETLKSNGKFEEASRVSSFVQLLDDGTVAAFYKDLFAHPLFLRLILDDVAAHGVRQIGRTNLLLEWSRFKIRRDIERKAVRSSQDWQFDADFITRAMLFMEKVAWAMTADGGRILTEYLAKSAFEKIARASFPEQPDALITALLNSLLVPRDMYEDAGYP
ncbi:MAG: hypothetical protein WDM86_00365 [Rhizomicrobium sp.]